MMALYAFNDTWNEDEAAASNALRFSMTCAAEL
jgi:hypothetical protein